MNCEEFHRLMDAYADDELDPLRSAEAEQHLQTCSACAAAYENLLALKRSTSAAYFTAPDELREKVRTALRNARTPETFSPKRDFRPWLLSGLAIAASVLLGFFLGQNLPRRSSDQTLLAEMIDSHVRSLVGTHLVDVVSSDQHTVRPWFEGKLDFAPPVEDLSGHEFPLVGGRVEYIGGRPVAALVYQRRKHFIDFFREKQHTIVPSSSLLPDAPNLLFTNAGMNQFVPIFLGRQKPTWNPPCVADTQKCIRAGGKHNDLEDVGLDTYHHTFFEMLGNWSFGDYFKKEAIEWAWELVVNRWKFPAQRLYATVYKPGPNGPSEFDQEAYDHWERLFQAADLDPKIHVVSSGKADNFWMLGYTGPCGPCSELHVDLTLDGDTRGSLVNKDDSCCIEIWNLALIQFNANPDGSFAPLPQRHVDTGMGFERVTAIIQGTRNLIDFSGIISNYETDIFRPIFDELEKLSGKKYGSTLPP